MTAMTIQKPQHLPPSLFGNSSSTSSSTYSHYNLDKQPMCYFSIQPTHSHFGLETPYFHSPPIDSSSPLTETPEDPFHPLLAARTIPYLSFPMSSAKPNRADIGSLLQLQTSAAYTSTTRPRPKPVQDVLDLGTGSDSGSDSSSSSSSSVESAASSSSSLAHSAVADMPESARCCRCQRSFSNCSENPANDDAVRVGMNLYYCRRCANLVGFNR